MKVIYLDIDGVLNCSKTRARIADSVGLDGRLIGNLKTIVSETNAKIVLISTWKESWQRDASKKPFQNMFARYLDERLAAAAISVYDKTAVKSDGAYLSRGEGILDYNSAHGVSAFVILDDYQHDYDGCGLTGRWVQTDFNGGGLTEERAEDAIKILKGE